MWPVRRVSCFAAHLPLPVLLRLFSGLPEAMDNDRLGPDGQDAIQNGGGLTPPRAVGAEGSATGHAEGQQAVV